LLEFIQLRLTRTFAFKDDSDEEVVSDYPKSQYDYYEDPIRFSEDHKQVSLSSTASDRTKIRVISLRPDQVDGTNTSPSRLTKSRCVYSIVNASPDTNINVDASIEEVEKSRSGNKEFCQEFLSKWNTNFNENSDFDLLAEEDASGDDNEDGNRSLEISCILMNQTGDVTTLDLTARHINLSPGMSGCEGESSATRCIRPPLNNEGRLSCQRPLAVDTGICPVQVS